MQLEKVTKLGQFTIQVLVDSIKAFLELPWSELADRVVGWVVVDVREEDGLRKRRLDMLPRAAITVTTCSNLIYKTSTIAP
jgi:hypothetical protein